MSRRRASKSELWVLDIETTTVKNDQNEIVDVIVYSIAVARFGEVLIFRSIDKFIEFLDNYEDTQTKKYIYVQYLGFDIEFFINKIEDLYILEREPHHAILARSKKYNIIFKCLFNLTGYSLDDLCKVYNLNTQKLSGYKFNYTKYRDSETDLTDYEINYIRNDVLACEEYLNKYVLPVYNYDLAKIPNTKTGIVRQNLCAKLQLYDIEYLKNIVNNYQSYEEFNFINKSFAGGIVTYNRDYIDKIIPNVTLADIKSSYPYVLLRYKLPLYKGIFDNRLQISDLQINDKFSYIFEIILYDFEAIYPFFSYISESRILFLGKHYEIESGKVYKMDKLKIFVTEYDFEILQKFYKFSKIEILKSMIFQKFLLPESYRNFVTEKFKIKESYSSDTIEYAESKGVVNSVYGISVTRNNKGFIECKNGIRKRQKFDEKTYEKNIISRQKLLKKLIDTPELKSINYPSNFAVGVFVTSIARYRLLTTILQIITEGNIWLYSDTDSVYYNDIQKMQIKDNPIDDICGFWDFENVEKMKIMGNKKYMKKVNHFWKHTIAGVPKKFKINIRDFKFGTVFKNCKNGHKYLDKNDDKLIAIYETDYKLNPPILKIL